MYDVPPHPLYIWNLEHCEIQSNIEPQQSTTYVIVILKRPVSYTALRWHSQVFWRQGRVFAMAVSNINYRI